MRIKNNSSLTPHPVEFTINHNQITHMSKSKLLGYISVLQNYYYILTKFNLATTNKSTNYIHRRSPHLKHHIDHIHLRTRVDLSIPKLAHIFFPRPRLKLNAPKAFGWKGHNDGADNRRAPRSSLGWATRREAHLTPTAITNAQRTPKKPFLLCVCEHGVVRVRI